MRLLVKFKIPKSINALPPIPTPSVEFKISLRNIQGSKFSRLFLSQLRVSFELSEICRALTVISGKI